MRASPTHVYILDEKVLDEVVATGASASQPTLALKEITVEIIATNVTDGGIFTFQGSPDGTNWGTVGSVNDLGNIAATRSITGNGTFIFEIVNASSLKYFRVNLSTRTDGTYTVYVTARA